MNWVDCKESMCPVAEMDKRTWKAPGGDGSHGTNHHSALSRASNYIESIRL